MALEHDSTADSALASLRRTIEAIEMHQSMADLEFEIAGLKAERERRDAGRSPADRARRWLRRALRRANG